MDCASTASGRALAYSALFITLASPAFGQSNTTLSQIEVPGTIVTPADATGGNAGQQTNIVEQSKRTDTVHIVDQAELEQKRSSVAYDVLETKPGLNVVRRLGLSGTGLSRLTIRGNGGVGPAGIQVFVDGRPDATVSFAHPTPSALSLADVESIEVISGPSPVLDGSGKTGAVRITTADPKPGLHGYIESTYGMYETSQNFASLSYAGKHGFVRLSGSYRETEGSNPDSDAQVENINFKGKLILDDVWNVEVSAARNKDDFNVFREFFVPGPFTDPRTERLALTQTVFDATINANFGSVVSSLKFFYDDLDPVSQVLDAPEERADVHEKGIRFKTIWDASRSTRITTGIDYLEAKAENSPVLPPFAGPRLAIPRDRVEEELDELSFYVFADQKLSESVTVSGGLRHTEHSAYDDVQSGEVGVVFAPQIHDLSSPLHGTSYRARYTRGYQSPTLQQLYGIFRGGRNGPANPFLGPEIVRQYEVGFNKAFRNGNFDIVFYKQEGEDLIGLPASPPPPPPDIQNDVEYENRGVEARVHFSPLNNLDTMVGVTISDLDQETNRFLRTPEKTIDFGVTYRQSIFRHNDFSISLFGRYAMDTFDVAVVPANGPRIKLDDYFVADMKMNLDVNDKTRLFFGIDNITDEDYELVTGIPATPLSVYGGMRLKL